MFSIIIPLYNKAEYIDKAICSVMAQTFQEFELIIVDDGSTDNPLPPKGGSLDKRLEKYPQLLDKIQLVEQKNQGVSSARNNGVKFAKYDFIAFLDADDWWGPDYLEVMHRLIKQFPEAGIYGSSFYVARHNKKVVANITLPSDFTWGLINYCKVYSQSQTQVLWTGATILKREVFVKENGFKLNLKLGEDFDLWVRIAMNHPVAFINKPLSNYNQDVDIKTRAAGVKLYEPSEHMLFTDYGVLMENDDFRFLYEKLALYALMPYYLAQKNINETKAVLDAVRWEMHPFKYSLYYRILPYRIVLWWFYFIKFASFIKQKIKSVLF